MNMMYFAISNEEQTVAMVQILLKKFPLIGTVARINRGPVLLGELGGIEKKKVLLDCIKIIIQECKKRWWWMLQIAPELLPDEETEEALTKLGLKKLSTPPWSSGLLPIALDEEEILMSLKGRWRRGLRKGIKEGVQVSLNSNSRSNVEKLIRLYKNFQTEKDFIGLSESLIREMAAKKDQKNWIFNIFTAKAKDSSDLEESLGVLVSIEHGDTAIYLIGATTNEGRKYRTIYVLFWEAILKAHRNGCQWFDIGGLNETTPKGIIQFKTGLKANPYSLIGEWRGFFIPKLL